MNEMYNKLLDILEDEIGKIVKDGEVTPTSLCNLDTLVDIVKDIHEISNMSSDSGYSGYRGRMYDDGYSGRNNYGEGRNNMGNYNRNNSYDSRYYDDGYGNDRYVRYEGDMHYSGEGNKMHMISLMEEAMDNATTKEEREKIMQMVKELKSK